MGSRGRGSHSGIGSEHSSTGRSSTRIRMSSSRRGGRGSEDSVGRRTVAACRAISSGRSQALTGVERGVRRESTPAARTSAGSSPSARVGVELELEPEDARDGLVHARGKGRIPPVGLVEILDHLDRVVILLRPVGGQGKLGELQQVVAGQQRLARDLAVGKGLQLRVKVLAHGEHAQRVADQDARLAPRSEAGAGRGWPAGPRRQS